MGGRITTGVAASLALAASIGQTTLLFQGFLGHDELTYFVPFAVAVLLLSLGSDYNVFVVGRIWQAARDRPIRDAVAVAVPAASRPVSRSPARNAPTGLNRSIPRVGTSPVNSCRVSGRSRNAAPMSYIAASTWVPSPVRLRWTSAVRMPRQA